LLQQQQQQTTPTTVRVEQAADMITNSTSMQPSSPPPPATQEQLKNVFFGAGIPMLAFGFMDQSVMIQSGNAIDCTIGVWFGLSTLTAAAIGQIVSAVAAVVFGGTVERVLRSLGIPRPTGLTSEQRRLKAVENRKFWGTFLGVVGGCCLGLVNLLFIDTEKSSELKLQALTDEQEFAFEIEATNRERADATTLKVRGPDVDGILASLTSVLTGRQCSLIELDADTLENGGGIQDVFVIRRHGKQLPDDELDEIAKELLEATRSPTNVHLIKSQMKEVEQKNEELKARVLQLEKALEDKQIRVLTAK
jgi:hypothetical protein